MIGDGRSLLAALLAPAGFDFEAAWHLVAVVAALGRHQRTFVRVDRRNRRSLALCDRVGLTGERPDPHSGLLVQRWGELPRAV